MIFDDPFWEVDCWDYPYPYKFDRACCIAFCRARMYDDFRLGFGSRFDWFRAMDQLELVVWEDGDAFPELMLAGRRFFPMFISMARSQPEALAAMCMCCSLESLQCVHLMYVFWISEVLPIKGCEGFAALFNGVATLSQALMIWWCLMFQPLKLNFWQALKVVETLRDPTQFFLNFSLPTAAYLKPSATCGSTWIIHFKMDSLWKLRHFIQLKVPFSAWYQWYQWYQHDIPRFSMVFSTSPLRSARIISSSTPMATGKVPPG